MRDFELVEQTVINAQKTVKYIKKTAPSGGLAQGIPVAVLRMALVDLGKNVTDWKSLRTVTSLLPMTTSIQMISVMKQGNCCMRDIFSTKIATLIRSTGQVLRVAPWSSVVLDNCSLLRC